MLWIKAFHVIAMVAWMSALFYLPRLFAYHAAAHDEISLTRFKVMERRLYMIIALPAGILTTLLGLALIGTHPEYYHTAPWLHVKLVFVSLLWGFHFYCNHIRRLFLVDKNPHSERFYRWINEIPTVLLIGIVILTIVKPPLERIAHQEAGEVVPKEATLG